MHIRNNAYIKNISKNCLNEFEINYIAVVKIFQVIVLDLRLLPTLSMRELDLRKCV